MLDYLKKIEKIIVISLILMMIIVLFLSTLDLGLIIVKSILTPPQFLLDINELLDIFGLFLLVLIGIELLESVKTYLLEKEIHVEVVFTVALIAIARKVIILDIKEIPSNTLLGIAAIVIALSIGYYLLKQSHRC
ncbi:MAG: phosphate-starvation-inducible E-like protein [Candidatus Jettenia sp.]|uniref:Phosphate-starvation-inducible E-like protein n=1 Tax=Candidatus Jettenia caeni TaxID=247490 RepID=I3IQA2_9BACT|nr:phosphate-starvation-inducible PsiE family protein [Candidatus Jettenia sp. AMX1]MBC6927999.1 phosphate-starvation-inducible E-like protein [Candidatus Jettenia sp.]NUN23414.1 phosphate-starvation-inducible PsiE family protein [Candidatus Jettenia caeni]KAA0248872.1 MAG: phosphate-starvation-inducible E-like protein [Candidatus Jettenia sp. AMX1]MCE7881008.1 phosphate-starvation-inducible E-like protein [Candidatus Jettenia sp. AMX1]MDL1939259.1 phosphate-starvation-inducible E-like protein